MPPTATPLSADTPRLPSLAGLRPGGAFASPQFRFTTGLRAGRPAPIRGAEGEVLLSYRSFASVTGIVATLVSAIVALAGLAAVLFLVAEGAPLRAGAALILTAAFTFLIAMLVPRVNVTLYDDHHPALTISQRRAFPSALFIVSTPNGATLAELRRGLLTRLGRNRWRIVQDGREVGDAVEQGLGAALLRKLLGKYSRRFETDVIVRHGGIETGRIRRRGPEYDMLELHGDALDRRIAVALATLVLGREP